MRRGKIWLVSFPSPQGGEIKKTRPAIIVCNNIANRHLNRVQVIPVTNNVSRCYPAEALILVEGKTNKAMADQIATTAKSRLQKKIAVLSPEDMEKVDNAIGVQLGLKG